MQKKRLCFSELNKIFKITFQKYNVEKNNVFSFFATFGNIIEICKIDTFQRNISTIFLKVLNINFFSEIFQKFEIAMVR